jgi:hypothetical protein
MGFFDDVPYQETHRPRGDPWDPPVAEFPCAAAGTPLVLARTEAVAVAVIGVWAFKAGFEFWASARFHHTQPPAHGDMAPQESAHIGLQFPDGRKAANFTTRPEPVEDGGPSALVLSTRGLGGGLRHREWSYWVWPLPPAGPVTFVCEWPAAYIAESRASLDAQLILDAAQQSVQLWPEDHD